jgi:hypothetical protein
VADHLVQAGAQGDDISHIPLIAAVVEREAPLLIDHQGQGDLAQVVSPLLVPAPLGQAGPTVKGVDEGVVVGGVVDQEFLAQGETGVNPVQQLPL